MRVISKRTLREFWEKHPNAEPNLLQWYQRTSEAAWKNLAEVRQVFLSADIVGNFTIFNISGNNYRLITFIDYEYQLIFIRYVLTQLSLSFLYWHKGNYIKSLQFAIEAIHSYYRTGMLNVNRFFGILTLFSVGTVGNRDWTA